MQSWMVLVLTNPYWFLCISFKITNCNVLASTLVISFRTEFKREIGLKSPAVLGLLTLGTRVIIELLIACKLTSPS
jgi:hypothetical protein